MRIYSGEIHKIFMAFSPDFHGQTKGIFMGSTYENTIKKAMKNSQLMAYETF